jgi:hypothetical protein
MYALDNARIEKYAGGKRVTSLPQNTHQPANHAGEVSCSIPPHMRPVPLGLIARDFDRSTLAISASPDWWEQLVIPDEMIRPEDIDVIRELEEREAAYNGDIEDD